MNETSILEERIQRRRLRRWKRRGRILAPFAAIIVLLGLLLLSVNIIQQTPQKTPVKAATRSTHTPVTAMQQSLAARSASSTPYRSHLLQEQAPEFVDLAAIGSNALPQLRQLSK